MKTNTFSNWLALVTLLLFSHFAFSQNDSLVLKNGNTIVGEIKNMDRGVLQIETSYSDKDFLIDINGIQEVYSSARFLFTTSDGARYVGTFKTNSNKKIVITDDEKGDIEVALGDIVGILGLEQGGFLSRLYPNIDFAFPCKGK